jgi:Zn-dependent M32 family carboxypeptidase
MVARQIQHTVDQRFGPRWGATAGEFLRQKFYSRGAEQTVDQIMQSATGEPLDPQFLIDYLRAKPAANSAAPVQPPHTH